MQQAINVTFPYALGMFESSEFETELIEAGIFGGEVQLKETWLRVISEK